MKLQEALDLKGDFKEILKNFMPDKVFEKIEIVDVKTSSSDPELKKIVEAFRKANRSMIQKKQCFRNAALLAQMDEDIDYVEGYAAMKLGEDTLFPFEHAWNVYKDKIHFDITSEFEFGCDIGRGAKNYAQLVKIKDPEKAIEIAGSVLRASQLVHRGKL